MATTATQEEVLDAHVGKLLTSFDEKLAEREKAQAERLDKIDRDLASLDSKVDEVQKTKDAHLKRVSLPGVEYDEKGTKPGEAYSLARAAVLAVAREKPNSKAGYALTDKSFGYEREVLENFSKTRTFNVGTDEAGGVFVPHEVLVNSLIPQLEAQAVIRRAGANSIGGLTGDLTWPVEEGGFTAYYIDTEGEEAITETAETFSSKSARPHTLAAMVKLSHKQMLQANILEPWVRGRFGVKFALREDLTAIEGTGSASQPLGVKNVTGIQTVDWGTPTYGGAGDTTQDSLIAHIYALREADAWNPAGNYSWVADPKAIRKLSEVKDADGRRMYREGAAPLEQLMGYPVFESTQFTTSATDAFFMFGDFSRLLLLTWGGLTLRAVEEGEDAKRLRMSIVGHMDHDVLVEQPKSFSFAQNLDQAS